MSDKASAINGLATGALNELIGDLGKSTSAEKLIVVGHSEIFGALHYADASAVYFYDPESLEKTIHNHEESERTIVVWFLSDAIDNFFVTPKSIWKLYQNGALILTISPQKYYINNTFLRASAQSDFEAQLTLEATLSGVLCPMWADVPTIFTALHSRAINEARKAAGETALLKRPLAILAAFNEKDVIGEAVLDLIEQGCDVAILDNWSDDGSYEIVQTLKDKHPERIIIHERFPDKPAERVAWVDILAKKEELANNYPGRWILHTDADEFRRSPFADKTLAEGLFIAQKFGANRVNFTVLNFRPVQDGPPPEGEFRESYRYFELPDHGSYFAQNKAWIQTKERVDLTSTGGHVAEFHGANDFPLRFWLKHLPIRSQIHASRKISAERARRWSEKELQKGWHSHYNDAEAKSHVWTADSLDYQRAESFQKDFGFIIATSLAAFFSPFWNGRKSTMRQWGDHEQLLNATAEINCLKNGYSNQEVEVKRLVSRVDTLGRWIHSLDPNVPNSVNDPYSREVQFNSLREDLNTMIRSLVIKRMSWRRFYMGRQRAAVSVVRDVFFSNNWYINRYADVAISGIDAAEHYLRYGADEGRDPCSFFSSLQYLIENPDVAAAKINPLTHFVLFGANEGRNGVHRLFLG